MNTKRAFDAKAQDASPNVRAAMQLWAEIDRARNDRDVGRVSRLADTLELLLEGVPDADREVYRRRINEIRQAASDARGGETYNNVIELFKTGGPRTWSVSEIQDALRPGGSPTDPKTVKAIYNTVNYLAKTGRLQRVTRGQYIFRDNGAGLLTDDIPDDGTVRRSENDD